MPLTKQQIADKWSSNLAGSSSRYIAGIQNTDVHPGEKAAEAAERMVAELQRQLASGELQAKMRGYSMETWKQNAVTIGAPRLASGAQKGKPKFERFIGQFMDHLDRNKSRLPGRGDREANKARMLEQFEINSEFKLS
jgi:hypothetical protein